jgi:glycosyltransferase involved in cell wall biosynthesis
MSYSPAISVIIPLYNKAPYVVRTVRSALEQQPPPAEVLVIDDGSTDDGPRLLEQMPEYSRIRLVRQKNSGEGATRNRGLSEMRGDLAAFLDADDEWLPGHLRNLLELARTYPNAGLFATGFRSVYPKGVRVETAIAGDLPVLLEDYFETARGGFCLHISSSAVWKSVALEAGGFAESEPLAADIEFFARVALRRPVALHPGITGIYHPGHPGSVLETQKWTGHHPILQLLRASEAAGRPPARSTREYADWILVEHALTGLYIGKRREAVRLLSQVRSLRFTPFRSPRLVRFGATTLPLVLLRTLIRLRRSRLAVSNLPGRNPVINRVVHSHA